jgi:copper(I)-binding protein
MPCKTSQVYTEDIWRLEKPALLTRGWSLGGNQALPGLVPMYGTLTNDFLGLTMSNTHFGQRQSHGNLRICSVLIAIMFGLLLARFSTAGTVNVDAPWARATVPGQQSAGAFMKLTADSQMWLAMAMSPVAKFAEVHEMQMVDGVMKMRPLKRGLELPAGQTIELKPGSYHLMLMDLKSPLLKDSTIPMTLVFLDAKGKESTKEILVPVTTMTNNVNMNFMDHHH